MITLDNNEKKYPARLFIIGFFMNITRKFFLFFPGILLLIIGIWVKWCLIVGIVLLLLDVLLSLVEQIQIRHATLNSDNPEFQQWKDAILSPNWQENVADLVGSTVEEDEEEDEDE